MHGVRGRPDTIGPGLGAQQAAGLHGRRRRPYLDVLPKTFTTPLFFSPDEVELLKGSSAYSYTANRDSAVRRQYQQHSKAISTSFAHGAPIRARRFMCDRGERLRPAS